MCTPPDPQEVTAQRRRTLAGVLPAMLLPTCTSLLYYVILAGTMVATVLYTATKVFTVVWPAVATVALERTPIRPRRPDWPRHRRALPMGLLTGTVIGLVIVSAYHFTSVGQDVLTSSHFIRKKVVEMGVSTPARYVIFCAFLSLLHSLIEEFFWRWYVFGRLARHWRPLAAGAVGSIAFAGHHWVVLGTFFSWPTALLLGTGVGVGGAVWCWQYRRHGTLAGAWLSHAIVDVVIFVIGYPLVFSGSGDGG